MISKSSIALWVCLCLCIGLVALVFITSKSFKPEEATERVVVYVVPEEAVQSVDDKSIRFSAQRHNPGASHVGQCDYVFRNKTAKIISIKINRQTLLLNPGEEKDMVITPVDNRVLHMSVLWEDEDGFKLFSERILKRMPGRWAVTFDSLDDTRAPRMTMSRITPPTQ